MNKKRIIIFSISTVIFLAFMIFITILPKIGYSSPENLLWLSPRVQCRKIYTVLESNERYLGVYKGDSAIKSEIMYEKNGRYFLYKDNADTILWERTDNGVLVVIRLVEGKYTIEVNCVSDEPADSVTDSLGSDFEYVKIDNSLYSVKQWFAAIDDISDNYYLDIDGEIITLNQ